MLACSRDFCKSLANTQGFFLTSLSILRCALAVIFVGRPFLGKVATVLNFIYRQFVQPWIDEYQGF
jgi:hypothetical protein